VEIALWSIAFAAVVVAGAFSWSASERRIVRMERRLGIIERKLDAVLEHLGVPPAEPGFDEVDAFLREGKKLHAIKAYRDRTGASLAEAKDFVERAAGER
jgi:ribosomal protein L7/L12